VSGSSETPAGARRRVRLAIRRAREVLAHLVVRDRATVDELVSAARRSPQRDRWWDAPDVRGGLTPALRQVVQLEPEAAAMRYFYPLVIPGRLQTAEYAQAVVDTFRDELPAEVIAARLTIRHRRRHDLLDRPNPPRVYVLLDESVLHREVGGPAVLLGQLRDLRTLIEQRHIHVRILPYAEGGPIPMLATYEIIYFSDAEDEADAVLYRESDLRDEILDDAGEIRRHRATFERLWRSSFDEQRSTELIEQRISALRT
jgi:hypothetical protein